MCDSAGRQFKSCIFVKKGYRILITTGGTGGHVFPAEALACELAKEGCELFFLGGGLEVNRYFHRDRFSHQQVASGSPFQGNPILAAARIWKGMRQSLEVLDRFCPDLVVGFGSFYTFPVLLATTRRKVPMVLFEPNAFPGKVNRFFSRWALFSAVQFKEVSKQLRGVVLQSRMPKGDRKPSPPCSAREYFHLDSDRFTFLVFGGSQGSESINHFFSQAMVDLTLPIPFQVIHITGTTASADLIRRRYGEKSIRSCVKSFESRMDLAWSSANLAICRSGAATLAEQIWFEVPSVLIPFPGATYDHQTANAHVMQKMGGAILCSESEVSKGSLRRWIPELLLSSKLNQMHLALATFNQDPNYKELSTLICEALEKAL